MAMRDTYHDFIEAQKVYAAGPTFGKRLFHSRVDGLAARSGALNVSSGVLHSNYDPRLMVNEYSVSFDSRAWTGCN